MAEKTKTPRTTIEKKGVPPKKGTRSTTSAAKPRSPRRAATKAETPVPVEEAFVAPMPASKRRPLFQAGTWISVLLLAALAGFTYYLNLEKEKTAAADVTPTLETNFVFTGADGVVSSIEIKPGAEGSEAVKIARNAENAWDVILPIEAEADPGAAEAAATQLTALSISSEIGKDKSPDIFGLDKPAYVITVEFKDKKEPRVLEVGDNVPSGNGYYVRLDKNRMMIADISGIESLLSLVFSPPYLNTPAPTALPATEAPIPTAEPAVTPTP